FVSIFFFVFVAMLLPEISFAQNFPDSLQLPQVEIFSRKEFPVNGKITFTDSLILATNRNFSLAELLSRNSSIHIKNYGPGALALPSFRGTAAGHTKLYWNGLPLTSPMLGVADFNLVPVFAVDAVEIQYGNAGLQQGSGGFGGNICLSTSTSKRHIFQAELMQNVGSFGLQQTQFKAIYGKKIVASTRVFYQGSDNNFTFENNTKLNNPTEKQQFAAYNQYGFVQTLDGEIGERSAFSAAIWYQQNDKQLPPLLTTANNRETQEDQSTRATFQYKRYNKNTRFFTDFGYSRELLNYDNIIADIHSKSIFQRYYIYPHLQWNRFKNAHLQVGLQAIADEATSPKYSRKQQQRMGLPVSVQLWPGKRFQISFLARPETVNFQHNILSFATNTNIEILRKNKLDFYGSFGRNYNFPTLNDLYWYPGGNADLLPENAFSSEAGFKNILLNKNRKISLQNSVSVFSTLVDNYIHWQPGSQGYWTAQNLRKVWSRGAEISAKLGYKMAKSSVSVSGSYSYTKSTSQKALNPQDKTVGKQLIYVPQHNVQLSTIFSYGKSIFSAQYIYTHFRYTPTSFLPAYSIINLQAETGFSIKKTEMRASLKCNNLLNASYQAIEWRPMPGRWFEAGLAIKFQTKLK
ncbi:MAG: TonB-dependent receptor, partial [Sphingobacteriales bacterium]